MRGSGFPVRDTVFLCIFLGIRTGGGSISTLHGITLSAWAFAGLSGNQLATWIVNHFGQMVEIDGNMVNPAGYQVVLYVTAALYLVALLLSMVFVRPASSHKKDI